MAITRDVSALSDVQAQAVDVPQHDREWRKVRAGGLCLRRRVVYVNDMVALQTLHSLHRHLSSHGWPFASIDPFPPAGVDRSTKDLCLKTDPNYDGRWSAGSRSRCSGQAPYYCELGEQVLPLDIDCRPMKG